MSELGDARDSFTIGQGFNAGYFMIGCDVHDYFEAVCVRRLPVVLHLRSGEQWKGVAIDLKTAAGAETIGLKTGAGQLHWFDLAEVRRLQAPAQAGHQAIDIPLP